MYGIEYEDDILLLLRMIKFLHILPTAAIISAPPVFFRGNWSKRP